METFLNLPTLSATWCAAVLLLASYVRGYCGFGFTGVLMIGLSMMMPIAEIVPLSIALEILASSGQAYGVFRDVNWRRLGILATTGFVGTPVGVFLLGAFPDASLRPVALSFVVVSSAYLIFSKQRARHFSTRSYAMAGLTIGVVNGATALSGLALALFLSLSDDRPAQIRATMIFYLFLADFWAGGILLASNFYDTTTAFRILDALPLLALGVWLGSRQFAAAEPATFRRAVLWLLLVLSALGLIIGELIR